MVGRSIFSSQSETNISRALFALIKKAFVFVLRLIGIVSAINTPAIVAWIPDFKKSTQTITPIKKKKYFE